jgi:hypothetical protein
MTLGWAIRGVADPGREPMVPLAKKLLEKIDSDGTIIIIPSVVLAEISVRMTPEDFEKFQEMLPKKSLIAPFDRLAAKKFGELWRKNEAKHKRMRSDGEISKPALKFDLQVISIALAQNASCIYTEDDRFIKIATDNIAIGRLSEFIPTPPAQSSLFDL